MNIRHIAALTGCALVLLCLSGADSVDVKALSGGSSTVFDASRDAYSYPSPMMDEENENAFARGRGLFRQPWVIAPATDRAAGLGPLFNRISCVACHTRNGRGGAPDGPEGAMHAMLLRLSIPGEGPNGGPNPHPAYGDQFNERGIPGVPGEGIANLIYTEHVEHLSGGETVTLRKPSVVFRELAYGPLGEDIMISPRVGPAVYGLGLLEAISDETLLALQDAPKPDGIRGRVNIVWNEEEQRNTIGRFGLKANAPTLTQQVAHAFIGDLGITSPLAPRENCTSAQTVCKAAPSGRASEYEETELSTGDLFATVFYHRMLSVPAHRDINDKQVLRGEKLFQQARCAVCHVPELRTRKDASLPMLSNQLIRPYTDLLLHDMGPELADNRPDYRATGSEWRTPPLWGIGLAKKVNPDATFLHDGRARTLLEAVMWHGGEATVSREAVRSMSRDDRAALIRYLESI